MKPERPLKSAVAALALAVLLYSVFTIVFAVVWQNGINLSGVLAGVFLASEAIILFFFAANLVRHLKKSDREVFSYRLLFWFLPAVLLYAGFEFYTGYLSNTAGVNWTKLNNSCYKQLDENKLCEKLLSGEDPENEIYHNTPAAKLLGGKIPKFRGIYTGDLATSFGAGGKIYLRLGRSALAGMKVAALKRDSKAYLASVKDFARVLVRSAAVPNDPKRSGETLVNEFIDRIEQDLSMSFPDDEAMSKMGSMLYECRENFEANVMDHVLNVVQGTFTRFDALKAAPEKLENLLDPRNGKPVWSEGEIFAGKLFPAARRNRLIYDYSVCIRLLSSQRSAACSVFSPLSKRLEQMKTAYDKCGVLNAPVSRALFTDISSLMSSTALAQTRIENALIAVEVENYRRKNGKMPAKLEDIKNSLLQDIPPCHADGSAWILESGRVSSKAGSGVVSGIPGSLGGILKQPGFRVHSGIFSFSIINR